MGAGMGFKGAKHTAAWDWLNGQDVDVALLQEVVPLPDFTRNWGSVAWVGKYQGWGSAVLTKAPGYTTWQPTDQQPWLQRVRGAVAVAQPPNDGGFWFASVHSAASSFEHTNKETPTWYADLPPRDGIMRCDDKEMWEIEPIAHEMAPVLAEKRFVLGGDLNSSRLFDSGKNTSNARLFDNLHAQGFIDLGTRHGVVEQQTYFKRNTRPFQLDYMFGDDQTNLATSSMRALTDVAATLGLSDHAPIELVLN